jgi:type II secretory ATPase GspE/PulE/Tfp pilus assembly ATPase PilB-like protein/ActR/RegA family two-component response regulator
LANAAGRAGLEGTVSVPRGTPLGAAWQVAAKELGMTESALAARLAPALGIGLADLDHSEPKAKRLLPEKLARRYGVFPLRETDREIVVASSDPNNHDAERDVGFASGRRVAFELGAPSAIEAALNGAYSADRIVATLLSNADATLADAVRVLEELEPEKLQAQDIDSAPLVKLTNLILSDAVAQGASDIHIEPGGAKGGTVRFRIDGVLRPHMVLPMPAVNRIVSRIKVLGKLDIADRMRPQDGRTRIQVASKAYDLRISTVPTRDAEKAVIRVLRPDSTLTLEGIGVPPRELARFRQLMNHRDGIVVVTGPTGSGKTTTLYAAITEIATGEVNVMTVEDPIEYELSGITQIQVETKRNVTFVSALRSILRQDPDVIFVGEIRDRETAEIAAQAAATGHLVLATLHTNDAMSAVSRLMDLGLDRSTIAAVLRGSLAQRLVRRVCSECVQPVTLPLTADEQRLATIFGVTPEVRATGCARCGNAGYRGRLPLDEVAVITPSLSEQIVSGSSALQLQRAAVAQGMRPMREVALERVRRHETTLAEVERVLGEPAEEVTAQPGAANVLLVDDDAMLRYLAASILEAGGYRVVQANDGAAALAVLARGQEVSLVITDLSMPGMNGEELVLQLRRAINTAILPVIVLTGTDEYDTEARLMDAGADDYIRKPIDPPRFLARVKAALRRAGVS